MTEPAPHSPLSRRTEPDDPDLARLLAEMRALSEILPPAREPVECQDQAEAA